jgi:hypothetical protein
MLSPLSGMSDDLEGGLFWKAKTSLGRKDILAGKEFSWAIACLFQASQSSTQAMR